MKLNDIFAKFEDGGPRSHYFFETFINNLFKKHLENQNKRYIILNNKFSALDAEAPDGIENIIGRTFIEIKFNINGVPPKIFFDRTLRCIDLERFDPQSDNILIISAKPFNEKWILAFNNYMSIYGKSLNIHFWGPDDINKIAKKNIKIINDISDNLFSLRIEAAMSEATKDWKEERESIISKIKELYNRGQFSLFLGAGVSSSAGMPDWNTLLNSLFVTYLTKEFNGDVKITDNDIRIIVERLNSINEPSALIAARYLRKGLSSVDQESLEFIEEITKSLYGLRDTKKSINSELIKSTASMCLPRRTGAKIKSVITYNFDDLLERQLIINAIQHRCIYTNTESYDPDDLPVYHVHGFLPEKRGEHDGLDKSTLVFSEEGYHQIYSDHYHWSNLVQLNTLRENNCLMIGLSMSDPNLRRLLDISSKSIERSKHFAFIKRLSLDEFCKNKTANKNDVEINIKAAEKFLKNHHALNEEIMKELGVIVVWYEKYEEIPDIINKISAFEK